MNIKNKMMYVFDVQGRTWCLWNAPLLEFMEMGKRRRYASGKQVVHLKKTSRKITMFVNKRDVSEEATIINRDFVQGIQQYIDNNDIKESSVFSTDYSRF